MRKYLLAFAVLLMGTAVMTSCSDDDDDDAPKMQVVTYSTGAYIVNSGAMYSNIESSLTAIDYASSTATQNVFKAANGRSLGNTANDGLIYGSKMYIVVDQSNTIEVLDKKTKKSVKQIKTTELMGDAAGNEPRHIIANDGNIYFTTYGGYVAKVDTASFSLQAKYPVGNYPEGLALAADGKIYVANSNYGMGGGNLSLIDEKSGDVETKAVEGINNPTAIYALLGNVYVIDNTTYGPAPDYTPVGENALKRVDFANGTSTKVADGNYAAMTIPSSPSRTDVAKPYFYVLNAPFGGTASVSIYMPGQKDTQKITLPEMPYSPCGIFVDPVSQHIFVLSYNQGDYGADYSANGCVVEYQPRGNEGTVLHKYTTGVGQVAMFFDNEQKEEPIQ